MTFAHVAYGSPAYRATHGLLWFDGAMGFVLLSGFVVAIVQRRTLERVDLGAAQAKALRRGRLVYLAHVGICALAFVAASLSVAQSVDYAGVDDFTSWWEPIVAALTLQINPRNASILSLYVILLLLTPLATWALARGRTMLLAVPAAGLFVLGTLLPGLFTLPRVPGIPGLINWATWQTLYFAAFLAGWHWTRIRGALLRPAVWISLLGAAILVGALAQARVRLWPAEGDGFFAMLDALFDDGTLGVGTIALAFTVVAGLYGALSPFAERWPRLAAEVGRVGRRSLDCYIILCILVLVVPAFWQYETRSLAAMVYGAGVLTLMYGWCRVRDARQHRRLSAAASASGHASATI